MPAKSKAQQSAMGIAAAVKEGKAKAQPGSPSAKIAGSMNLADIKDFASTPRKGLPAKAPDSKTPPMQSMPATPTPAAKAAPPTAPAAPAPMKMRSVGKMKKIPGSGIK